MERLKAHHGFYLAFDSSVILLHSVIEKLDLADFDLRPLALVDESDAKLIRSTFVDVDFMGLAVVLNGLLEETFRSFAISLGCEKKINGLAVLVHGSVEVLPL